ncbi:MAG: hypothetical protein SWH68_00840 [Thermodesulfobacteriota bacterium]|nr:hypothetical protein [Thermodesulfobacteriota bacterium]
MPIDEEKDPCEACRVETAVSINSVNLDGIHQNCPRCGEFKISGTALSMMGKGLGAEHCAKLSGWVRNHNTLGSVPLLTSDSLKTILAAPIPSVMERATMLLVEAKNGQEQ